MEWDGGDVGKDLSERIKMVRGRGSQAGRNPELRTGFRFLRCERERQESRAEQTSVDYA